MELTFIINGLKSIFHKEELQKSGVQIFIFGSALQNTENFNDIDLLIIYHHSADLKKVKEVLRKLPFWGLFDILSLTKSEELEFNFIESQKAVELFKLEVH